ncbi:DinB family protein [Aureibaculum sp. 2210JD6-5]|uniref:DinB family protein n=1 Tax=Aureibaculum sp. 2210JD6-5 TaxID=3103957 RepID=UPI002AAD3116|nr:DinB family protein [Aureibaculum sp. 2210JD6-5]MDY7393971.1 DinB family protein [Aureibaculum sp. 2210JD6-5]
MKKFIIYFTLGLLVMSTIAFMKVESKTTKTADVEAYLTTLNGSKTYTLQIAEAMPSDKYDFRPTDSVRSFGEQMAHIAMSSKFLVDMFVKGEPMPSQEDFAAAAKMEKEMGASKEACIKALTEAYDLIAATYENMSDDQLAETFVVAFDPKQPSFPKEKAFQFISEHNAHHRGQALVALRMQGIKSPDYKLY